MGRDKFTGPEESVSPEHLSGEFLVKLFTFIDRSLEGSDHDSDQGSSTDATNVVEHLVNRLPGGAFQLTKHL